ncbi:MAG: ribose 1,5-bisphosphate isomerase [bacterium (Candidatus Ratteibacteria) CG_4_10_14_3_um_filter_41_18]|uniref:Thiamine thiazole synthase n=4 Tax=Candidatus Ratteibacteria TaxID=2979319 RepID=A0A2M7E9V7_9BACT|nr:MAG: ribose 1,5-bisphosphate isomerase [Candidatus Omnitrophica bacterium CG1_02_41_171]PIV64523.1 MAG: ribose 1,5-bisphosphate isomerase [bacterium (Candidatus Ratteibacteria) CG01_land_8_20_14_3_00_40_19]PIW33730.1 MAG: ribose 1,5-bisphosphate isomerase [bacterium (Candidatus Ratteibacteria) CG15_BIG_FIL_POST_REV_8_21_14_020_41_12]PIW73919.1 MAG: ribose 1,5-bisphosphate isomerase [bacterium (Candidatus Ratteibacteria) CG_4_8_14_3_um_filter_41_36]PIX76634.1 MAG: ribose 1,5-bisphosphate isom
MKLDDVLISKAITEEFTQDFLKFMEVDVAIVGAGPSGMVTGYYLAKKKKKVVIFERKLSVGGGMWGGGMMFNKIVVQEEAKPILKEIGVNLKEYKKAYYVADAIETVSTLSSKAVKKGVKIFNLISVEDVMIRKERVAGLVLNWTAVEMANLHVDPLTVRSKFVVDSTGHSAEVANIILKKMGRKLLTKTGELLGEKSMWAEMGEKFIVGNSKEIYPGLYVAGMAANAVFGAPRMGPIFGGMLLSGKRVAELLLERLK